MLSTYYAYGWLIGALAALVASLAFLGWLTIADATFRDGVRSLFSRHGRRPR